MPLITARRAACLALGVAFAVTSGAVPAAAQARDTAKAAPSVFTRHDAFVATGLLAGALALMPADEWFRNHVEERSLQSSTTAHAVANDFSLLGDPGTVILSLGTYAVGRIAGNHTVSEVGLHATEALLLSAAATELVKGVAGRARPYVLPPDADEFAALRGFSSAGRTSFPSGHTSAAFSLAAVVDDEGAIHWPHAARIITPVTYGLASLVGLSRIYKDRHWMSDVAVGALVGEYSGLMVERYNRSHPHNALERWLVPSAIRVDNETGKAGQTRVSVEWSLR
ncbi:MAG TPA: phosphatase PAP2 family protein [Gemmatimonadaceae bacterium]|nr:phosphatase PAP2 family protein [Gemmatimonadaceae bacterium]